MILNSKVS